MLTKGNPTDMENNRNAKNNVSPSVGANDFKCPYCKGLARHTLSYEQVMHIRAMGGGTDSAHCVHGHEFKIIWYVWSPMGEQLEVPDGQNA
jgi:hypothetical protein